MRGRDTGLGVMYVKLSSLATVAGVSCFLFQKTIQVLDVEELLYSLSYYLQQSLIKQANHCCRMFWT